MEKMYLLDQENILENFAAVLPKDIIVVDQQSAVQNQNYYQIIQYDGPELKSDLLEHNPERIIVLSKNEDESNIIDLLHPYPLYHLVGMSNQLQDEVMKTVLKIKQQNIWGIEKYLNEDAQIKSVDIYHSKDTQSAINELLSQVDTANYFETPKDYLSVIANELISNAFYHMQEAPTTDRTQSIFVTPPMAVTLRIGVDGQKIALSVGDHSGSLTRDQVVSSLERSYRERTPKQRTPGAGLGLYLAFQHSNQLIFNRSAQKKTEIIAIIEASKRFIHYKQRVTSFHFFEEDSYV